MTENDGIRRSDTSLFEALRAHTPARLLVGRAGCAYRTATQLQLRSDQARARDAVWREFHASADLGIEFVQRWKLFEVCTRATSKSNFVLNPPLGRELDDRAVYEIAQRCPSGADLQVVIGDGLSAQAVAVQVPTLLPLLVGEATSRGWSLGQTFMIRHCRVGVMNAVGDILRPRVLVLLIGERPGMSAADSLSAYMAYQPRSGHTDADRNLISNIHGAGVTAKEATVRIANFAAELRRAGASGTAVKEPPLDSVDLRGKLRDSP